MDCEMPCDRSLFTYGALFPLVRFVMLPPSAGVGQLQWLQQHGEMYVLWIGYGHPRTWKVVSTVLLWWVLHQSSLSGCLHLFFGSDWTITQSVLLVLGLPSGGNSSCRCLPLHCWFVFTWEDHDDHWATSNCYTPSGYIATIYYTGYDTLTDHA